MGGVGGCVPEFTFEEDDDALEARSDDVQVQDEPERSDADLSVSVVTAES